MKVDMECELLCQTPTPIPKDDAVFINQCIADEYAMNWMVDGLPAAHGILDERTKETYQSIGVPLGDAQDPVALNNHYDIYIKYHKRPNGSSRVVGVEVLASSKDTKLVGSKPKCERTDTPFHLKADNGDKVIYTYSVTWTVSTKQPEARKRENSDRALLFCRNRIPLGLLDGTRTFTSWTLPFIGSPWLTLLSLSCF